MTDRKLKLLINVAYYAVLIFLLVYLFKFVMIYLFPVIIGLIVTVMVQRPAMLISNSLKVRKGNCALVLVVITYISIILLIMFVLFRVWTSVSTLISNYSYVFDGIGVALNNALNDFKNLSGKIPAAVYNSISDAIIGIIKGASSYISSVAKNTAKTMPMFFTGSIVTIVASCYIAKDYDRFKDSVLSVMSAKYKKAIFEFKILVRENILKLIKGYIKLLFITFGELSVGFLLLRIKDAVMLAIIVAIIDLLPILGTGAVLIPWGAYQIIVGNYYLGAGLLILYVIIMIVRNILEPKIIGKQIGLHPLISLIAVFIGFRLFGFIGIFTLPLAIMVAWKMYERGIFSLLFSNENN